MPATLLNPFHILYHLIDIEPNEVVSTGLLFFIQNFWGKVNFEVYNHCDYFGEVI